MEIILKSGAVGFIDDTDSHLLGGHKWQQCKGRGTTYLRRVSYEGSKQKTVLLHRLVMNAPAGVIVDHVNGNGLDNRRGNLRLCDDSRSLANRRHYGRKSPYKGIWKSKGSWRAAIGGHKRCVSIGTFGTPEEAASAYDIAAVLMFGEFACLNFPEVFPEFNFRQA